MNYIGSISILDRGDAPAQAVIDRNARSLAQRVADETRDELNKVMSRVHTIYNTMDTVEDVYLGPSMEYINDLAELEEILKDEIKKRQYQQQVTVFIVGYQDVCFQKLRLLQQVNEFFMENSKRIDEEDWFPTTPDMDMEEVSNAVEDSLNHAHELTNRLAELNKEMVEYMAALAEKKASNKGKKKIEKALQLAKDEVSGLKEKLLTLQRELDDKEEKVQSMFKQLESKNLDVQKFRTAAELGKKASEEMEVLRKEISMRDAKIVAQRQQLSKMEVELTQTAHLKERTETKFSVTDEESQQRIIILQKELDEQKQLHEETKDAMTKLLDNQINALHESHRQELDELKKQYESDAKKMQEALTTRTRELARSQHDLVTLQLEQGANADTPSEVGRVLDLDSEPSHQVSRQSSKQESRPTTKDTKTSGKSLATSSRQSKTGSKSPTRTKVESKPGSRTSGAKSEKEFAEIAIQDEGGDPTAATIDEKVRTPATRQSRRSKSTLEPVLESDFDNAFDLFDEQSWASVPNDQLTGKFAQYRRLSTHKLRELEEQLQLTTAKTRRKVATLKAQFQEHKSKWEAERKVLIEQVDQSLKLQGDAEKEADAAMTQLEDFITEQEQLEKEEEIKRNEVLHASASLTPQDPQTPVQGSVDHTPGPGTPHPAGTLPITPDSEQELQRLMQQTDDAKVQELNARLGTSVSAPPAVDVEHSALQRSEPVKPKSAVATVAQGTAVQLSNADHALSHSGTPIAVKLTNKATGEVQIREVVQGTVTPFPTPEPTGQTAKVSQTEPAVATTFLTPDGKVVTEPTSIQEAATQGLIPVEVHGGSQPGSRVGSGVSRIGSGSSVMKPRRSPIESPTKQVSFVGAEPLISPRSSKFRRAKTADLAVVMEFNLGSAHESALDNMKRMLTDEEGLKPKQAQALESMRAAVKSVEARNALSDEELARTLTMLALASQMSHEAFQLGVRPDSIFRTFSCMNPQSLSQLASARLTPKRPSASMEGRESTRDNFTRETTLASVQEEDSDTVEDDLKQEAEVDLTQLKELPLLDIGDAVPEDYKPSSAFLLPSEATISSSIQDNLDTPLSGLLENDPIKLLKEQQKADSQNEPMDDGSNLEKAHSRISEREATQGGGSEYVADNQGTDGGLSKQATEASMGPIQKSFLGQSITSLEGAKIDGTTEEEIRASSAHSRASLREQYKVKLEEAKNAAEERRSKSPAIQLPAKLTVDDELVYDEDDDAEELEEEMAVPDDMKEGFMDHKDPSMYDIGTSPPPGVKGTSRDPTSISKDPSQPSRVPSKAQKDPSGPFKEPTEPGRDPSQPVIQKIRKGTSLLEHPLLQEYLRVYDGVVGFKDGMGKIFLDKDMMSAHQMTSELETLTFDQNKKAMPQVEELSKNVLYVLEELNSLINNILVYDREPPVSSLNLFSREATQKSMPMPVPQPYDSMSEQPVAPPATRDAAESVASSHHSKGHSRKSSNASDKLHIRELQEQYNVLKQQLEDDGKNHQEQLQRNTVVMMEMQDTINDLQRELSALGKIAKRTKSALSSGRGTAVHQKSPSPETSVMFTRLDSERNAKIMKKAVMEEKLDSEKYKEAVAKMDEYVSIPAQRLAHLVKKYIHHNRMKEIEEKVKNSSSLDDDVFQVLDKMENLQNQRARQWAERMDEMGLERLKLANLLMDTLDTIEQESGIFLIKPMYSYRGRDMKPGHAGKLSRPVRHQHRNATPSNDAASFVPAPTPASNYRLVRHERHYLQQQQQQQPVAFAEMRPVETRASRDDGEVKIKGSGMTFSAASPRTTWNMQASQPWTGKEDAANSFNTPRILELDINRMLIGQNNISSKVPFPASEDRLVNANQNTLRSYVTVNRPTAATGSEKAEKRPGSGQESVTGTRASTRSSAKKVRVSEVDKEIPASLPSSHPLPPITPTPGDEQDEGVRPPSVAFTDDGEEEENEPPQSPPGSSMYQSVKNEDGDSSAKPT